MSDKKFGEIIRSAREAKNLTQAQLAAEAGVTSAYISELENDRKMPPPYATTAVLAQALSLLADELWEVAQAEREEYKRRSADRKKAALQIAFLKEELSDFEQEVLKKVRTTKKEDRPFILRFLNSRSTDQY
jgi:transcriptional regulator with XRE-family HTH domain